MKEEIKRRGKYIEFAQIVMEKRKTKVEEVKTKEGDVIGIIKWYGRWRQYSFFPKPNTVFEKTCLADITDELKRLKEEWRLDWKLRKMVGGEHGYRDK